MYSFLVVWTNYRTLSHLKQQTYTFSQFPWPGIQAEPSRSSAQGLRRRQSVRWSVVVEVRPLRPWETQVCWDLFESQVCSSSLPFWLSQNQPIKDFNYICKTPLILPCYVILGVLFRSFCYILWLKSSYKFCPQSRREDYTRTWFAGSNPIVYLLQWVFVDRNK